MISSLLGIVIAVALALHATALPAIGQSLDFEFFKSRVEPVFLKKRPEHARCYVCHSQGNNAFRLQKLSPGTKFWTEEQSRHNFEVASALVVPGKPDSSRLLLQPLAPEAGGNVYHSGGRQFASKNDPDWKILAQWVSGQTQAAHSAK